MLTGIAEVQRDLRQVFEVGLREKYGEPLGGMLGEVIAFYQGVKLDPAQLQKIVDNDATPVLSAVVSNRVDGATLRAMRSQVIGSALMTNKQAVVRWATEGLNRSRRMPGNWADTAPQWQQVLDDPDQFILLARQIKHFMNQI